MSILREIKDIPRSVRRALEKKKIARHWRATVAAIVTKERGHWVLFVLSSGSNTWSPPKGGVEAEDVLSLENAALRELLEEVRLEFADFKKHSNASGYHFARYLGSALDDSRPAYWEDEQFQIGKKMHCVHLVVKRNRKPRANRSENVSKFVWVKSLEQFNALPMPAIRRAIWLVAMSKAGVPWAQDV